MLVSVLNRKTFLANELSYGKSSAYLTLIQVIPLLFQIGQIYMGGLEEISKYVPIAIAIIGFFMGLSAHSDLAREGRSSLLRLFPIVPKDVYRILLTLQLIRYAPTVLILIISYALTGFDLRSLILIIQLNGLCLCSFFVTSGLNNYAVAIKDSVRKNQIIAAATMLILTLFTLTIAFILYNFDKGIITVITAIALNVFTPILAYFDFLIFKRRSNYF